MTTSKNRNHKTSVYEPNRSFLLSDSEYRTPKQIKTRKRVKDTHPFSFRVAKSVSRHDADPWFQNIAKRFDFKKVESSNVKFTHKSKCDVSTYLEGFTKKFLSADDQATLKNVYKK